VFVLMEMSRGAMYLWAVKQGGTEEIANERDSMDSFQMSKANSCTAQTTWFKTKFLPYHPELEVLVNDLKRRYCRSGNAAAVVDTKALLQRAYSQKCVSNNGTLCIFSVGDALTYAPLMGTKFSRLEVYVKDCSYMFKGMDLTNVDKIDFCGMATRMQGTFENAKLDIIDIIGTENVEAFGECFKHSRLETLTGMDTSSATTCNSMFMGATTQNNGRLKLPKFDLSNCTNIGGMFQNTNIAGVTMVNTGKVQVAVGCYTNCPYLVSYPPTKFDSITDIKQLTGTEELIDMFAGCSSLTNQQMLSKSSAVDFEAELAATAEFYSRPKSLFDSDGYYIVKSSADMNNQFYQKNKTKIDKIKIAGDISI